MKRKLIIILSVISILVGVAATLRWSSQFGRDLSVGNDAHVPFLIQGVYYKNYQARWELGERERELYVNVVSDMRKDPELAKVVHQYGIQLELWGYGPQGLIVEFVYGGKKHSLYDDGRIEK